MTTRPTIDDVIHVVLAYYPGISRDWLLSDVRFVGVVEPRHLAMALSYEMTGYSLPSIGRHFLRDHTTVRHAFHVAFPKITAARGTMIDDIRRNILDRAAQRAARVSSAAGEPMPPITREELLTVCAALRSAAETIAAALRTSQPRGGQDVQA